MATLSYTAAQIDTLLGKADTAVQPTTTGDLSDLATSTKTDLVSAINETFTSASNGKTAIAAAITGKGVPTSSSDSFATMAANIALIGGSSYTKIASVDYTVSTTATTGQSIGTIALGSTYWTANKIIYVRIRDKAGARDGYFVGSDVWFFNHMAANGTTGTNSTKLGGNFYYSSGAYGVSTIPYGVYGYSINNSGDLAIYARYSSGASKTIDGTYNVTVYTLDYAPDQGNPFDYSFS